MTVRIFYHDYMMTEAYIRSGRIFAYSHPKSREA
jgi:hypothetical protein